MDFFGVARAGSSERSMKEVGEDGLLLAWLST